MFSFKILRGKLARGWQKIIHLGMRRRLTAVFKFLNYGAPRARAFGARGAPLLGAQNDTFGINDKVFA